MWPLEYHALVRREQYRDYLVAREQDRLAAMLRPTRQPRVPALQMLQYRGARRLALPLGRTLLRLGLRLLRLGAALEIYGAPVRAAATADCTVGNGSTKGCWGAGSPGRLPR
jgi:hypothetical protein